ncbi:MAG: glycosyltransferase, partial [Bacillota bacterium]
ERNWKGNGIFDVIKCYGDDCFFCELDADDEYNPDFLEKMLAFITEYNLDVATYGTDWVDDETGKILRRKVPEENIILEGRLFADRFPAYRNFMVTLWGGLFSLKTLRSSDFKWYRTPWSFSDTCFCMESFRKSNRAGVFAESLHKYYIASTTDSNRYNRNWFSSSKKLLEITKEYLLDYGRIDKQNENYLSVILLILIRYILPRIQNAGVELSEKLNCLYEIFNDEMTQHMLKHWSEVGIYSDKGEFLREINDWIISQDGWRKHLSTVEKIIASMNIYVEETE